MSPTTGFAPCLAGENADAINTPDSTVCAVNCAVELLYSFNEKSDPLLNVFNCRNRSPDCKAPPPFLVAGKSALVPIWKSAEDVLVVHPELPIRSQLFAVVF